MRLRQSETHIASVNISRVQIPQDLPAYAFERRHYRTKENVNDARTLLGGSDVDWKPSRSGSGSAAVGLARKDVLSSEMFSALYVRTAMLNKNTVKGRGWRCYGY